MKVGDLVCYAPLSRERMKVWKARGHHIFQGIALEVDDSSSPPIVTVLWSATSTTPVRTYKASADELEVVSESR